MIVIINEKINFTKIVWLRFNVTNDFWSNTMRLHPCFFTHLIINFFLQFSPGISVKILLKVKYYKELNNLHQQSPTELGLIELIWHWPDVSRCRQFLQFKMRNRMFLSVRPLHFNEEESRAKCGGASWYHHATVSPCLPSEHFNSAWVRANKRR